MLKKISDIYSRSRLSKRLSPNMIIALVFLMIILVGACLLTLPFSSRSGVSCGFLPALFTSTSATCVTGLVLYDTWVQFSWFGQIVIICLIEIGGLGFMSVASAIFFLFRKKIGMKQQLVMQQGVGASGFADAVSLQKTMLKGCILIEALGAVILSVRFAFDFPVLKAVELGVFHSVSAFCNAGFDILGFLNPGGSVAPYATDPVVILTLSALIILGGLGFFVWHELINVFKTKKITVYTKLCLITTAALLVGGTLIFLYTEYGNSSTIGSMSLPKKILASFFQSVTTRTAGFAGIDQGALTDTSKAATIFLMLIGGSSGSTAGGLKTVTFVVILLFLLSKARGKENITAFKRTIKDEQALNALTIFGLMVTLAFVGAVIISKEPGINFLDALYETVSALATVGLTTGVTPKLNTVGRIIIMIYMYFGRVGILTIILGFFGVERHDDIKYADVNLLIG